jgi:hypothetical protein
MRKLIFRASGFLLVFLLSTIDLWAQCAMCRGSVQSTLGNGRNNVGIGINVGIMYLFVIPYICLGVIAYFWYRNSRKLMHERQMIRTRVQNALDKGEL